MTPWPAATPASSSAAFRTTLDAIRTQVRRIIVGQDEVVEHLLLTMLVGGHCLITGMPGTAKTLLVRTLADALGLSFKRIQFTPDLMPTDVTGTDIIEEDPTTGRRRWTFVPGPLFANVLLADEINRTPPKTQAALLEAMQERTVSVRGNTRAIEAPFFVLATQNPIELEGTYPLPEAQLDRFLFNILLDYLSAEDERLVVERNTNQMKLPTVEACTGAEEILKFQWLVRQVPVSEAMQRMAVDLVRATRPGEAGRARHRQTLRPLRRERARHAVHHRRGESPRADGRSLSRERGRHPGAGATGAAAQGTHELSGRVRRHDGGQDPERNDRRQIPWSACVTDAAARLLTPEVLAGLANLELVARTAVEGFLIGLHRSPHFGFSQEFAEFRAYNEGDDPRFVDWNVFARTDRTYIRRYEGETNTRLMLLLDASASMGFQSAKISKLQYGKYLAAALAYLASKQHDPVGLIVFDEAIRHYRPASGRSGSLQGVLHALDTATPGQKTDLEGCFRKFREHLSRRGLVAIISDLYCDPIAMSKAVAPLAYTGHDMVFFHVLDPGELRAEVPRLGAVRGHGVGPDDGSLAGLSRRRVSQEDGGPSHRRAPRRRRASARTSCSRARMSRSTTRFAAT